MSFDAPPAVVGSARTILLLALLTALLSACDRDTAPLRQAVRARDHDRVRVLLEGGMPSDGRVENGITPLAIAASLDDLQSATLLIDYGAALDGEGNPSRSPRAQAETAGAKGVFDLLVVRQALAGRDPVHLRRVGPPESSDYVQRVLTDLGYKPDPPGSPPGERTRDAVRAFQASQRLVENGEVSREVLLTLWVLDPLTQRSSRVSGTSGECHVCLSRVWRRTMGQRPLVSEGGCQGPTDVVVEHVVAERNHQIDLETDGFFEILTRHGDGCRAE